MKQIFIFILVSFAHLAFAARGAQTTAPASLKALKLKPGAEWILTKDLTLQKSGLTPEEFIPYVSIWNLKTNSFMKSSSASTDSCEFRTAISKKLLKQPAVQIKKSATFRITNIQETTMSVLVDIVSKEARKANIDQIQITCSAYEQGLDSPELKSKFKKNLSTSLATIFASKN